MVSELKSELTDFWMVSELKSELTDFWMVSELKSERIDFIALSLRSDSGTFRPPFLTEITIGNWSEETSQLITKVVSRPSVGSCTFRPRQRYF